MPTEKADVFTLAMFGDYEHFIRKFNISKINDRMESGSNLLQLAISGNNDDIAVFLLNNGINVNMQDNDGDTALHRACESHNITICRLILEHGYDINIKNRYGNTALWTAVLNCKQKYYEIVELLMQYSPDVSSKNNVKKSPLDFAWQIDDLKLIEILERKISKR